MSERHVPLEVSASGEVTGVGDALWLRSELDRVTAERDERRKPCDAEGCTRFEGHNGPHITDWTGVGWITEESLRVERDERDAALAQVAWSWNKLRAD